MFDLNPVVDVPQKLLLDLAVGLDAFDDICARYNYSPEQTDALRNNPGIRNRVSQLQAELKESGVTFRMRNAHAAEDMIGVIWAEARRAETSLDRKIEAAKLFAKLGDLEPKAAVNAVNGGGVTISINIPALNNTQTTKNVTIDHETDKPLLTINTESHSLVHRSFNKNNELYLPEDFEIACT